jgi:GcrA cell cycle regulator
MAWTKERISLLIDLWTSGKSASVVAKEIGCISRNAVIGKIHRLGIANRINVKKITQKTKLKKENSEKTVKTPSKNTHNNLNMSSFDNTFDKQSGRRNKNTLLKKQPSQRLNSRRIIFSHNPNAPDEFKKLSLFELKEGTCRWPSGDPKSKEFHFCGCQTHNNAPYCDYHAKIAYTQIVKRDAKSEQKQINKDLIVVNRKSFSHSDNSEDNLNIDIFSSKNNPSDNINFL